MQESHISWKHRHYSFQALLSLIVLSLMFAGGRWALAQSEPRTAPDQSEEFKTTVGPFLNTYCMTCHGADEQEAGVRYDRMQSFELRHTRLWTKVHEKLTAGEMPPADQPQPEEAELRAVLSWIEKQQSALETGSLRRLNRRELSAALQDLTGLSVDYAAMLPADGKLSGFDTGTDALHDSAASLTRILEVTRRAVEAIGFEEFEQQAVFTANLREADDPRKALEAWKEQGLQVRGTDHNQPGEGLVLAPRWLGERGGLQIYLPDTASNNGVLKLKLVVSSLKNFDDLPNSHLSISVGGNYVDRCEIVGSLNEPQTLTYEVQLNDLAVGKRGLLIELRNEVEVPYAVAGFDNDQKGKPEDKIPFSLFRPAFDKKKLPPEKQPVPFVVLQQIEVTPDYRQSWPPADWNLELEAGNDPLAHAKQLLSIWIERAWRRPVSDTEQARFVKLYEDLSQQQMPPDEALRATFQSVLLSGSFRFLASPADPDETVAQHAIASRLAFMLHGSPPDTQLRQLALAGKLRQREVLLAQIDRLLDAPQSHAFFEPFVTQWLELEQPITLAMDHIQQQDFRFGRYLKESMRQETIAYVAHLVRENRPAKELIDSDYTMLNNSLAIHYDYPPVDGGTLRKVTLPNNDSRGGGILSHAGIQSMLCWMGDNWVIYRGAWTLRNILDAPPPPPPLEVPELDPSAGDNRGKTFRELLLQHQNHSKCAICHKDMDPLGFAFQNFDLSGRWREREFEKYTRSELDGKIQWRGSGDSRPVDAAGHLPRGETFQTFSQFKQLMAEHYLEDIVRGHLKRLTLYATGRTPTVHDLAEIEALVQQLKASGYPMRDLLQELIASRIFLER